MDYYGFQPGDPGDTPNGAWVREAMRRKNFKVDRIKLAKAAPPECIEHMFYDILRGGGIGA